MRLIYILIIAALLPACSSAPRTKWSDKSMRVMIDPDSIDEENYVQVLQALVKSDKFTVVDRARGWKAAKKEQERLHRVEGDRYDDKEKWAHWSKLYGVGGIVVAYAQCMKKNTFLSSTKTKLYCKQHLHIVDSNTGEVIAAADGENDGESTYSKDYMMPDWDNTVASLVDAYPKNYTSDSYRSEVRTYQEISKEHTQRQREERESSRRRSPASSTENQ